MSCELLVCAEGFQEAGSEARPLIAVFGMSAATKQNGKLIDSCGEGWGGVGGAEEKAGGGVCICVCVRACASYTE